MIRIAVLPGDGIGPEITAEAIKILEAVAEKHNSKFEFEYADFGELRMIITGIRSQNKQFKFATKQIQF